MSNHIKETSSIDDLIIEIEGIFDTLLVDHPDGVFIIHRRKQMDDDFHLIEGIAFAIDQGDAFEHLCVIFRKILCRLAMRPSFGAKQDEKKFLQKVGGLLLPFVNIVAILLGERGYLPQMVGFEQVVWGKILATRILSIEKLERF